MTGHSSSFISILLSSLLLLKVNQESNRVSFLRREWEDLSPVCVYQTKMIPVQLQFPFDTDEW